MGFVWRVFMFENYIYLVCYVFKEEFKGFGYVDKFMVKEIVFKEGSLKWKWN